MDKSGGEIQSLYLHMLHNLNMKIYIINAYKFYEELSDLNAQQWIPMVGNQFWARLRSSSELKDGSCGGKPLLRSIEEQNSSPKEAPLICKYPSCISKFGANRVIL